jgi:phosphohistidine phosphatase
MLIYIVRHGPATPREEAAGILDDRDRQLTPDGKKKTRQAARGMRALGVEVGLILTSPYARARQTADIVASELGVGPGEVRETALLEPGVPAIEVVREVAALDGARPVMLVGHQPGLGQIASVLLTGDSQTLQVDLKKASLCTIEGGTLLSGERAVLCSLLQPGQLRGQG